MRRAAQRDKGEAEIVEALRKVGCTVQPLNAKDVPDLLCGRDGKTYLLEVKRPKSPRGGERSHDGQHLSDGQRLWHERWRGSPVHTVRSVEEALAVVGVLKRETA